jgi:hypothetical protein
MFIQQNFFSSPGQVAWVYDPHTDEEGCFGWVSGEVHRLSSLLVMDRNDDGVERTPKHSNISHPDPDDSEDESSFETATRRRAATSPWIRWSRVLLTHASVLLIGFTLSYFLFPRVLALIIDPTTGEFIVRDGRALLPYLDQRIALPPTVEGPKQSLPAQPPPSASPSSTITVPAQPASPRSTH